MSQALFKKRSLGIMYMYIYLCKCFIECNAVISIFCICRK